MTVHDIQRSTCPTCRRPFLAGADVRATDDSRTALSMLLRPVRMPPRFPSNLDPENLPWVEELVMPIVETRPDTDVQDESQSHPEASPDGRLDEDDRSEFSGMYS